LTTLVDYHEMKSVFAATIFVSSVVVAGEFKPPVDPAIDLVAIRAGTFWMGSPTNEPGRASKFPFALEAQEMEWRAPRDKDPITAESPQSRVTISKPFWLGKTEVTRAQFEALMGRTDDPWPKKIAEEWRAKGVDFGKFPIVNVTWDTANDFCRRLTERERAAGRLPSGLIYSLPTEAQWEYACRAGTTSRNYAGDDDALAEIAWFVKTTGPFNRASSPRIQPVALKKPNALGLFDMLGNAREWTLDWIGPYPGGEVTDPRGPSRPVKPNYAFRVQRGGAWIDPTSRLRCAARNWSDPSFGSQTGFKEGTVGFRVAVVSE
jgi:formylglycine-generating enzyme required for sulfatase activity